MEHRVNNGIRYFTSEGFSGEGVGTLNAFTTRTGGVSPAPFDSLDLSRTAGIEGNNEDGNRAENLRRLGLALGIDDFSCALVSQVHGNTVFKFDPEEGGEEPALKGLFCIEADAIISVTPGTVVGVLTADCLPILLYDPVTGAAGAVHAGWRGTFERVAQKAVEVMVKEYGINRTDLRVALGPSIGPCCYTVQRDFYDKFVTSFGESINNSFIFSGSSDEVSEKDRSIAFDLQSANRAQLLEAGVLAEQIDRAQECTCCHRDLFFSYRRDVTVGNKSGTGRMLGMVMATGRDRRHL